MMNRILLTPFWLPKGGNAAAEYEDAFFPIAGAVHAGECLRFAVADGATEGMLSGQWANLLVKLFKRHWQDMDTAAPWLAHAYRDWTRLKEDYIRRRNAEGHPIQWYEEPGLEAGAFSTLLGVTFQEATFEAIALGDSCLFQVRDDAPILQFPFSQSSEFNNRPVLLSSNPARNGRVQEYLRSVRGNFSSGDRFYLMTDALAAWSMRELEAERAPWSTLDQMGAERQAQPLSEWITTLRQTGQIRNDDVTCVRLQVM
ncbi:MAG: protein phosphatase 2C domain-containing protein [Anaerolineae bacterium]